MKTLSIRPAKIYDVPALARIERESFAHPWSAEQITRDIVANDRAFVAVAVLDGEPVGYADMWIVAGEAQLYNIAVAPEFRGAGIGSILMKYMAKTAARAGCSRRRRCNSRSAGRRPQRLPEDVDRRPALPGRAPSAACRAGQGVRRGAGRLLCGVPCAGRRLGWPD